VVDKNEEYLIGLYHSNPGVFHPSQRKSIQRQNIRDYLRWTDEQIEGWFVMLQRDVFFAYVASQG
jgi:hypothetical protein